MTGRRGEHLSEDELVLHHYGEDGAGDGAAAHLEACAECRDSLAVLRRVLIAVDEGSAVPARGAGYGRALHDRLRPHLERTPAAARYRLRPLLALAATLVIAFLLGRLTSPPRVVEVEAPGAVRERVLLVAISDHLDRSRAMLVELTHTRAEGTLDLSREREWAQDLVSDNRLYRQTAERSGQLGVASVLDELERVLLELANSPDTITEARLAELVERIESRGIVFKVTVLGNSARERVRVRQARQS